MAQTKGDVIAAKEKTAMEKALEMAPKMEGRLIRNEETGVVFGWTPILHIQPFMHVVSVEEQKAIEAKQAGEEDSQRDEFDNMTVDELKAYGKEFDIAVSNMKDPAKIKAKIRDALVS